MATHTPDTPWEITVQRRVTAKKLPSTVSFRRWAAAVLTHRVKAAAITFRIVTPKEMTLLNGTWRHKPYPTNVLSFPLSEAGEPCLTGDIVICAAVVAKEARTQQKPLHAHWAHMVVHGLLHLLGYDHEDNEDAEHMEAEEIRILNTLGFANPYCSAGRELPCPG